MSNRRVLFVDDEVNVVEGIKRQLRKSFDVSVAIDPEAALALLESQPDFAVVVSDMRMPQMSGIEFLNGVKKIRPDSIRIMLTGNQDQLTAAAAVNQGEVFKFLNKPCDAPLLTNVLEQALRQYELVNAERELLSRTLQGSIKVLIDALSLSKPEMFGSIERIERKCSQLSSGISGLEAWEMQAAARLSRLGCMGISNEALNKIAAGAQINSRDRDAYNAHPEIGSKIVAEIPRLERVAQYILYQNKNFDGSGFPENTLSGPNIPLGARVLRLVLAFDELQARGASDMQAMSAIRDRQAHFDPQLVDALQTLCQVELPTAFRVTPDTLRTGLTIAEDVLNSKGLLLVCRGQVVTPGVQRHLRHFHEIGLLSKEILVTDSVQ